ncbi:hypothetical protein QZH41_003040 [Actinostola sp. cb2023]|nr:hypothetical protein QZH41_003040 [Actinostola sp. cb2023]
MFVIVAADENFIVLPVVTIKIRRVTIMADMIGHFKDNTILSRHVIVFMVNAFADEENGLDNNGVFLDALSAFWSEFDDSCTTGEQERIPVIRHDFQREEWESVARILVKGYQQVEFFPVSLNQAFVVASVLGEKEVSRDLLLKSFLAYVSKDERELLHASLTNTLNEEQTEEWIDFLDRFKCKTLPKPEKVRAVVEGIAHRELIQCPRYITDCWTRPCSTLRKYFSTAGDIDQLYERVRPSNKKVLALLSSSPETNAQREALSFLERYVRGIGEEKLYKFLRFCTGSTMLCVPRITVVFNTERDGCARRPVAHTCGAVLEIPTTYQCFPQFRNEMNKILTGEYWDIDFH